MAGILIHESFVRWLEEHQVPAAAVDTRRAESSHETASVNAADPENLVLDIYQNPSGNFIFVDESAQTYLECVQLVSTGDSGDQIAVELSSVCSSAMTSAEFMAAVHTGMQNSVSGGWYDTNADDYGLAENNFVHGSEDVYICSGWIVYTRYAALPSITITDRYI